MVRDEIYVSTDVEADGPIPGPNSMLSLGSAAFRADKTLLGTFESNLETLPGAAPDPETMRWWSGFPEAFAACRVDPRPVVDAMRDYCAWLDALPGRPIFVAYPAGFDFTFVRWYLMRFAGRCPFGFAALDIKSFAMARLGTSFVGTTKRAMPKAWFDRKEHPHRALADAIEQGELFCNMLAGIDATVAIQGTACTFRGIDDEHVALHVLGPSSDARELRVAVDVEVGGLRADVTVALGRDEISAFWFELRALRLGEVARCVLEPRTGSPVLELRARDATFAMRARVRDPGIAGQELSVGFELDRRAVDLAFESLAAIVAAHPEDGTADWD